MTQLHMNDIINSPLSKSKEEISSKDLFSSVPKVADHNKPMIIKVEKTVNGPEGSKTTFTVSVEHTLTSAQELKPILDAIGIMERNRGCKR